MSATANTDIVDRMQTLQKLVGTLLADRAQKLNVLTEIDRLRVSIATAKNFPLTPLQMESLEALARERQRGRDGKFKLEKKYMAAQPTQPEPAPKSREADMEKLKQLMDAKYTHMTASRESVSRSHEADMEELKRFMGAKIEQMMSRRDESVSVRSQVSNPTTDINAIKQRMQQKLATQPPPVVGAAVAPPVATQKSAAEIAAFRGRLQRKRELEEATRALPVIRASSLTRSTTTNTAAP